MCEEKCVCVCMVWVCCCGGKASGKHSHFFLCASVGKSIVSIPMSEMGQLLPGLVSRIGDRGEGGRGS